MSIIGLIVFLVVVGVLMWLLNRYIPMPSFIRGLINFIVFILLVIYVLQFFGLIAPIIPFPKI